MDDIEQGEERVLRVCFSLRLIAELRAAIKLFNREFRWDEKFLLQVTELEPDALFAI